MLNVIALGCLAGAMILLFILSVCDLKTRLLPNEMVLGFAALGFVFHLTTMAEYLSIENIVLGGVMGFFILYVIRVVANRFYREDALGMGDVKLLGAAGIWLGPDAVLLAMAGGAFAAMAHGLIYGIWLAHKTNTRLDLNRLKVPAGPGFAVGILGAGIYQFWNFHLKLS